MLEPWERRHTQTGIKRETRAATVGVGSKVHSQNRDVLDRFTGLDQDVFAGFAGKLKGKWSGFPPASGDPHAAFIVEPKPLPDGGDDEGVAVVKKQGLFGRGASLWPLHDDNPRWLLLQGEWRCAFEAFAGVFTLIRATPLEQAVAKVGGSSFFISIFTLSFLRLWRAATTHVDAAVFIGRRPPARDSIFRCARDLALLACSLGGALSPH